MTPYDLQIDAYRHMLFDEGLMPGSVPGDFLDANDRRPFRAILGATTHTFHLHCVPTPQQWRIEDHLPLVWFDVACSYSTQRNAVRVANTRLTFRIFASSPDGAQIYPVLNRIILLFDGSKDGQFLWNACPLRARYAAPYRLDSQSPIVPSSIERVYRAELSFVTDVLDDRSPRGSLAFVPSPLPE